MRAREMAEAQQAARQSEREKDAANRTCQQARAAHTQLESECHRLGAALSSTQSRQR